VAVLLSRFPLVTETFILREIDELERQGQPVRLVPLLRERPAVVHPEAVPWMARALYTSWVPAAAAAALRRAARRPAARRAVAELLRGMAPSPAFLARTVALLPKALHLAERLAQEGIAHLHAHFATHPATVAWLASRLSPLGYSVTVHAHDLFVDRTFLGAKMLGARFVRAVSAFNRDDLLERWPALAGRVHVVHVGVEPERYAVGGEQAAAGRPPLVLCVAALKPYKGIPVLLAACERLLAAGVELRCAVVGSGPLRAALEAEVARRGLGEAVSLLGALPQGEVAALVREAAVIAQPSVVAADGQMEGIPVALMEGGAAGKPLVAASLSGIPELVEDGVTGLLFPPGDDAALAERLARVLSDEALARRLGAAAASRVRERFALRGTTAELLALLDRENPPLVGDEAEWVAASALLPPAGRAGLVASWRGADSRGARLLVAPGGGPEERARPVVLKQHLPRAGESAPPRERARSEAELLRRLARGDAWGTAGRVPPLLGHQEAPATLLLADLPGVSLDHLLRAARRGGAELRAAAAACRRGGEWLEWFQRALRPDPPRDGAALLVERARGVVRALPAELRGAAVARAERLAAALGASGTAAGEAVPRHGDLWPGNLRLHGDVASALDFEGWGWGHPAEDAATFLVHAELYFPPPLGSRLRACRDAFLAGWGGERAGPAWELAKVAAAARAVLDAAAEHGTPALRPWRSRVLRRHLVVAAAAPDGRGGARR
jgi:glycosyltransferase involved in cell wall biosynthesis